MPPWTQISLLVKRLLWRIHRFIISTIHPISKYDACTGFSLSYSWKERLPGLAILTCLKNDWSIKLSQYFKQFKKLSQSYRLHGDIIITARFSSGKVLSCFQFLEQYTSFKRQAVTRLSGEEVGGMWKPILQRGNDYFKSILHVTSFILNC